MKTTYKWEKTKPIEKSFKGNYLAEKDTPWNTKLLSEKDKEALIEIKRKFYLYKQLGFGQVRAKEKRIKKLEDLANGIINYEDFIKDQELEELKKNDLNFKFDEEDIELEFFPISPNIINYLEGEFDKKHLQFSAQAINPEVSNEIIEARNEELKQTLKKLLEGKESQEGDIHQIFLEKLNYFKGQYRHEIEQWANHVLEVENKKFNLKSLFREMFRNLLIHEEPYVHINLVDNYYYPEILDSKNTFYIKSKDIKDSSDYTVFGWFKFENLETILGKYQLNEEDTKTISLWAKGKEIHTVDNDHHLWPQNKGYSKSEQISLHNYKALQGYTAVENYDLNNRLVRVTTIYWLEPKKIGLLTVNLDGELVTTKVDDNFKLTKKAVYKFNKKDKENILEGEHIEWFYINELWKGVEIAPIWSNEHVSDNSTEKNSVFINLGPNPIQYAHKSMRYGIKIPVHGGSNLGWSVGSRTESWQKFFNFLGNRSKQILYTEVGKFLLLNENLIPDSSKGGSWAEEGLLKFFIKAKELSIAPVSQENNVPSGFIQQGFGQVVDLEKTNEVANKLQLMQLVKSQCYEAVGINLSLLQDRSPYQTATSAAQQQDVTLTQLQPLYSRAIDIIRNVRETMVETALYLTAKGEYKELNYINSEGQRIIFNLDRDDILLHQLGIFIDSDLNDLFNLERMKSLVMNDNTMGSDALEKSLMLGSKTSSELFDKLKSHTISKDKKIKEERDFQQKQQQEAIQAQERLKQAELKFKAEQAELDRLNRLEEKRIGALGYGNSTADEINNEIKEREIALKEAQHVLNVQRESFDQLFKDKLLSSEQQGKDNKIVSDETIKLKELELRSKEIDNSRDRNRILSTKFTKNTNNKK